MDFPPTTNIDSSLRGKTDTALSCGNGLPFSIVEKLFDKTSNLISLLLGLISLTFFSSTVFSIVLWFSTVRIIRFLFL